MFYNAKFVAAASWFLFAFFFPVFAAAAASDSAFHLSESILDTQPSDNATNENPVLSPATRSDEAPNATDRIILVYPLEGCEEKSGAIRSEGVQSENVLELQSPQRARDVALNELERRVNEHRNSFISDTGVDLRYLSPDDAKMSSLIKSSAALNNESKVSVKLSSRYLSAVQMEVAKVPPFMNDKELAQMSETLPCVNMVSRDYTKKMAPDPNESQEPLEFADPSVLQRQLADDHLKGSSSIYDKEEVKSASSNSRYLQGTTSSEGLISPNDQLFSEQWHLHQSQEWSTHTQREWSQWKGNSGMVVAIIDSGCDLSHPDLQSKRWTNTGEICGDGIDNDHNGYVDDCYGWDWVDNDGSPLPSRSGHGTAAAGIIAAATNNKVGIAGICWDCQIMCLRFIDGAEGRVSNQIAAIDYAAKMGAKISNNSYGGYGFSKVEFEGIKRARAYGHLFVSSAGNNNYDTDKPEYPHTPSIYELDNIIAIGASTREGKKASFSNYGSESVDVYAPGSRIVTVNNGGGYAVVSGTSFAAPMAAGAAALVWSRYPTLSSTEVRKAVISSCKTSKELAGLATCGGVIDVEAATRAAAEIARSKPGGGSVRSTTITAGSGAASTASVMQRSNPVVVSPAPVAQSTGILGAFLSGFNRAFSHTSAATLSTDSTVIVEDKEAAMAEESGNQNSSSLRAKSLVESTVGLAGKTVNSVESFVTSLAASPKLLLSLISNFGVGANK